MIGRLHAAHATRKQPTHSSISSSGRTWPRARRFTLATQPATGLHASSWIRRYETTLLPILRRSLSRNWSLVCPYLPLARSAAGHYGGKSEAHSLHNDKTPPFGVFFCPGLYRIFTIA